jgi:hypothetical protein
VKTTGDQIILRRDANWHSTQGKFTWEAVVRAHHILAVVTILAMVLTGADVALTSFATPRAKTASHSAPPVSPLLFGGD